ncbi:hypothetical protein EDD18DRAFT_1426489 [Armillaria luteobubalina]|uniref:Uncharacterized protein n=1 Tax=Armillaria luteobubalina TaxID=153913 RepID=A0AA39QHY7_9AGAR|nr:hypothetical protein EDD18DRAFT_1426489 [Armillaria luteobubalina]
MVQIDSTNAGELNQPPPWVHQIHKMEAIRLLLKGLTLGQRLKKNTEIEQMNEDWALAHLEQAMDPDAFPDLVPDDMSLITIKSHERRALKVLSFLAAFSRVPKALCCMLAAEEVADKELDKAAKRKNNGEDPATKKQACDERVEKPRVLGQQNDIEIHQLLKDTDAFCSVPLHYFTNKNLQYINVHAYHLPVTKVNPEKGKKACYIIDIPKLNEILGKEEDMMFGDYTVAHPKTFHLIVALDPAGLLGTQARFYKKHFLFFNQQIDKVEEYPAWCDLECKERMNYHISPTLFESSYYFAKYKCFKLAHHIREEMAKQLADQLAEVNKQALDAETARRAAKS